MFEGDIDNDGAKPAASTPSSGGRTSEGRLVTVCRIWRGWTDPDKADAYQEIVWRTVIPEIIEARAIPGFQHIDLMRRDLADEVEFATIMWFDSVDAIRAFVGEDYEVSHVPPAARAVLKRFDERAAHYQVLDRRPQPGAR